MPQRKSERKNTGKKLRKTIRKSKNDKKCAQTHIIRTLMEMLNVIKLYHWNTKSYPEHKATDELYARLNDHVDKFVEVSLGKKGTRIVKWNKQFELPIFNKHATFKTRMYEYLDFLVKLDGCFISPYDSDLLNIRDEILADVNQFLYLLTFK